MDAQGIAWGGTGPTCWCLIISVQPWVSIKKNDRKVIAPAFLWKTFLSPFTCLTLNWYFTLVFLNYLILYTGIFKLYLITVVPRFCFSQINVYCCFVIQAINASFHKHKELFKDGVVHIPVFLEKVSHCNFALMWVD